MFKTLLSCLARLDPAACFAPLWRPKFVTKLAAEDYCHLNGSAMDGGKPCFVTAVCKWMWPMVGGITEGKVVGLLTWRAAKSLPSASPCRTRAASMATNYGCTIPGPVSSALSICRTESSNLSRLRQESSASSVFMAIMPLLISPSRATTRRSPDYHLRSASRRKMRTTGRQFSDGRCDPLAQGRRHCRVIIRRGRASNWQLAGGIRFQDGKDPP